MMVVGISGSPKKAGNTEFLLGEALAVAKERGFQTERLLCAEMSVDFCNDCGDCSKGKPCPKKDDMPGILEALEKAEGIIVASPVYFGNVTGQLKAVFDRTIPCDGRASSLKIKSAAPSLWVGPETAARKRPWRVFTPGCTSRE